MKAEIERLVNENDGFKYQMLGRLQNDVKYFLGAGNGNEKCLWGKDVLTHIEAMTAIYDSLPEAPEWCPYSLIAEYKNWMLNYHKDLSQPMTTVEFFRKIDALLDYDRTKITAHFDRCRVLHLKNDCFDVGFNVRQQSEPDGYMLYIKVRGDYGDNGEFAESIGLYTIEEVTPAAIKNLSNLGVDFMLKAEDYMRNFADDFQWTGYRVIYQEPNGGNSAVLGWREELQWAKSLAKDIRNKHKEWKGDIRIISLNTRKEVV